MPLEFGNGLLLQYTVSDPKVDDKLSVLEVGLAAGMTSMFLMLISAMHGEFPAKICS